MAIGPDGRAYLAWEARDPSRRANDGSARPGIAYATRGPDGAWSVRGVLDRPPYLQVDGPYPGQSRPAILADTSGGVHVLSYGAVGGVQQILYGWTRVGRGFFGWYPVAPSSGDQRYVAAALDRAGRLHVAWREGLASGILGAATMAIYYSVREPGGRWLPPVRLTRDDENASTPSVGVSGSQVSVAWIAWSPGAMNSQGQVDNGFPADNATVEGRLEAASSPIDREHFSPPALLDAGPASYPCWAVVSGADEARPPLVWTSRDPDSGNVNLRLGWFEGGR